MKQLIPKNKQKLIYIQWQDAHSKSGWVTEEDLLKEVEKSMCLCEEVGWIVYEDKDEIHIVSRRGLWMREEAPEYGQYQRIPKAWILKKKVIVK